MTATQHYFKIKHEIAEIALKCHRNPLDITLIAVSKGFPVSKMMSIYDVGCRDFGESRLQEALPKITEVSQQDIKWHFIGSLQKNKVRRTIQSFSLIHSVDTSELVRKIAEISLEEGVTTSILLQVNVSGEKTKHGLSIEKWKEAIIFSKLFDLNSIRIEGLMTMAPLTEDEEQIRSCFSQLRQFRDELAISHPEVHHLSMGMSHDYKLAIAEGATLLRIGTAIFEG
jgi:pyridoxal phosphate enzyme (YggS family)